MAGFLLQAAVPLVLLAVFVGEVVVGEVAPLLLGFAFEFVPVAASLQLGLVVEVVLVNIQDGEEVSGNMAFIRRGRDRVEIGLLWPYCETAATAIPMSSA